MKSINKNEMTHQEWLDIRSKSIGSSDAGVVVGANPWKTIVDLYFEKVNKSISTEDNLAMKLGRELEPILRRLFLEETGLKVRMDNKIRVDKEHNFLTANLDGMVQGEKVPIELKTASRWTGDIPDHYFLQIQHQMMVTDVPYIYFAVLVLGFNKRFIVERYDRNENCINHLRKEEVKFWMDYVIKKNPPPPTSVSDTKLLYPEENKHILEISDEDVVEKIVNYRTDMEKMKSLKTKMEDTKLYLMEHIKDNEGISVYSLLHRHPGPHIVTWKKSSDRQVFDTKKFKKENEDLYNKYLFTKEGSRRFIVK